MSAAALSTREVAKLAGTTRFAVNKMIEDGVLSAQLVRSGASAKAGADADANADARRARRRLPLRAVTIAGVLARLDLPLPIAHKKRLAAALAKLGAGEARTTRLELLPAVTLDVGRLVGDAEERAQAYVSGRERFIEVNDAIMSGTPVIRGTRMSLYSVLGRISDGETIDEVAADNPDVPREALEAALVYARTHPLVGRPGGRPWERRVA